MIHFGYMLGNNSVNPFEWSKKVDEDRERLAGDNLVKFFAYSKQALGTGVVTDHRKHEQNLLDPEDRKALIQAANSTNLTVDLIQRISQEIQGAKGNSLEIANNNDAVDAIVLDMSVQNSILNRVPSVLSGGVPGWGTSKGSYTAPSKYDITSNKYDLDNVAHIVAKPISNLDNTEVDVEPFKNLSTLSSDIPQVTSGKGVYSEPSKHDIQTATYNFDRASHQVSNTNLVDDNPQQSANSLNGSSNKETPSLDEPLAFEEINQDQYQKISEEYIENIERSNIRVEKVIDRLEERHQEITKRITELGINSQEVTKNLNPKKKFSLAAALVAGIFVTGGALALVKQVFSLDNDPVVASKPDSSSNQIPDLGYFNEGLIMADTSISLEPQDPPVPPLITNLSTPLYTVQYGDSLTSIIKDEVLSKMPQANDLTDFQKENIIQNLIMRNKQIQEKEGDSDSVLFAFNDVDKILPGQIIDLNKIYNTILLTDEDFFGGDSLLDHAKKMSSPTV